MAGTPFDELDARAISVPFLKGSIVFRSGERASGVYLVRTGKIALVWTGSNSVKPMDTREAGGIFAAFFSFAQRARCAAAIRARPARR